MNSALGDYLVDRETGQPEVREGNKYKLEPGDFERWYTFTTLGDGEVGSAIGISAGASEMASLRPWTSSDGPILIGGPEDPKDLLEFNLAVFADRMGSDGAIAEAVLGLDVTGAGGATVTLNITATHGTDGADVHETQVDLTGATSINADLTEAVNAALAAGHRKLGVRVAKASQGGIGALQLNPRRRVDRPGPGAA